MESSSNPQSHSCSSLECQLPPSESGSRSPWSLLSDGFRFVAFPLVLGMGGAFPGREATLPFGLADAESKNEFFIGF